jgi:hypothetical protein
MYSNNLNAKVLIPTIEFDISIIMSIYLNVYYLFP